MEVCTEYLVPSPCWADSPPGYRSHGAGADDQARFHDSDDGRYQKNNLHWTVNEGKRPAGAGRSAVKSSVSALSSLATLLVGVPIVAIATRLVAFLIGPLLTLLTTPTLPLLLLPLTLASALLRVRLLTALPLTTLLLLAILLIGLLVLPTALLLLLALLLVFHASAPMVDGKAPAIPCRVACIITPILVVGGLPISLKKKPGLSGNCLTCIAAQPDFFAPSSQTIMKSYASGWAHNDADNWDCPYATHQA